MSEDSDLARQYPEAFKPAATRDSAIRSEDEIRVYGGADALIVYEATATSTPTIRPGRQRRSPVRYSRSSSTATSATPADAKPAWDLGPGPTPTSIPPTCVRRFEPDEISAELRAQAQHDLRGIAGRTTGRDELEVGGLLLGRREGSRMIVLKATESGPNCIRGRFDFTFDLEHDLALAARLHEQEGLELCGIWHSHPVRGYSELSDTDLRAAASWRMNLGVDAFLFTLMARDQAGRWSWYPFVARQSDHNGPDVIRPSRTI